LPFADALADVPSSADEDDAFASASKSLSVQVGDIVDDGMESSE
jgi:hypothetical protein